MSSETPSVPGDHPLSVAHLEAAFSEQELRFWDQPARFKVVELDSVVITSGAVVPGDPMFGSMAALKRRVPPGTYPVSLALVHLSSGDERIAFARMLLSACPVVTWERGWHEAAPGEYAFYYSHAGAGCFMDAAAIPAIRDGSCIDIVNDGFDTNYRDTWSWFSFKPQPSRPENIVCYRTEPGGRNSHVGLDRQGNVAVIVTDFRMF